MLSSLKRASAFVVVINSLIAGGAYAQVTGTLSSGKEGSPRTVFMTTSGGASCGGVFCPAWIPTSKPFCTDPSVEPIAADEPVAPAGFPVLPDRLDLPFLHAPNPERAASLAAPRVYPNGHTHTAVSRELKLEPEPRLIPDSAFGVKPPQVVTVNQAVTQDLGSPEDDFARKTKPETGIGLFRRPSIFKQLGIGDFYLQDMRWHF